MLEGWLQNLKVQQNFWKRMCHWGRIHLGVKGCVTNRAWPLPEAWGSRITFSIFDAIGTIVRQHRFIGGAAPQLKCCARTELAAQGLTLHLILSFTSSSAPDLKLLSKSSGAARGEGCSHLQLQKVFQRAESRAPRVLPAWALAITAGKQDLPCHFLPLSIFSLFHTDLIQLREQVMRDVLLLLLGAEDELYPLGWGVWG